MLCLQLRARTKSLFSIMKKLLRLGNMAAGGPRQREEIYDLLGMRAIVQPRTDLPPDQVRTWCPTVEGTLWLRGWGKGWGGCQHQ